MKSYKLSLFVGTVLLLVSILVPYGTDAGQNHKVNICHATGSKTNPYVFITVDENAIPAHSNHQDGRDIIGVNSSADCPKAEVTVRTETNNNKNEIPDHKIGICHATGSKTNPYVFIVVDEHAVKAHSEHQDGRDIIGAKSIVDCPQVELAKNEVAPTASPTPTCAPTATPTNVPTATPTTVPQATTTPTNTPTSTPTTTPTPANNTYPTQTPAPTNTPTPTPTGQVLGASTLPNTGSFMDNLALALKFIGIGFLMAGGVSFYKKQYQSSH